MKLESYLDKIWQVQITSFSIQMKIMIKLRLNILKFNIYLIKIMFKLPLKYIFNSMKKLNFINSDIARKIDEDLMSKEVGFSIDQLMEIAGLSISKAVDKEANIHKFKRILNISGPGSNILTLFR